MANNYTALGQYLKDLEKTSGMTAQAIAPRTEPAPTVVSQPIRPATPRIPESEFTRKTGYTMVPEVPRRPGVMTEAERTRAMQELPNVTDDETTRAVKWLRTQGNTGPLTESDLYKAIKILRNQVKKTPRRQTRVAPGGFSVGQSIRRALIGQVGEQMRNLLLNR